MKKEVTSKKILKNLVILCATIVLIAIAAHILLRVGTRHGSRRTVPQLTGISLREAEVLTSAYDLNIFINDSLHVTSHVGGTVLDQLPAAGVEVKPGRTIYIIINAFGDRMVEIPYVAGRSLRQAKNMLDVAGLEISQINYVDDMATNYVLEQSYRGRDITAETSLEAAVGSGIMLTVGVSQSDPYTLSPSLIGLSLREAKSRIWESGLNVGRIEVDKGVNLLQDKGAKVYIQSVGANTECRWGRSINITLTTDNDKVDTALEEVRRARIEYEKSLLEAEQRAAEVADSLAAIGAVGNESPITATGVSEESLDEFF